MGVLAADSGCARWAAAESEAADPVARVGKGLGGGGGMGGGGLGRAGWPIVRNCADVQW